MFAWNFQQLARRLAPALVRSRNRVALLLRMPLRESDVSDEIKVGDIVCLKSGGPRMTVDAIAMMGEITCKWFHQRDVYPPGMGMIPSLLPVQKWDGIQRATFARDALKKE